MSNAFQLNEETGLYQSTRALTPNEIIEGAAEILEKDLTRFSDPLSDPQVTRDYLKLKLSRLEHEVFSVIFLDNRHRVISFEIMFRGTIDGSSVHPREVVKTALKHNAAATIFAHNHPSGDPEPSKADETNTQRHKRSVGAGRHQGA